MEKGDDGCPLGMKGKDCPKSNNQPSESVPTLGGDALKPATVDTESAVEKKENVRRRENPIDNGMKKDEDNKSPTALPSEKFDEYRQPGMAWIKKE